MKPAIFKTETDLVNFIDRLPVSDRKVKVPGMFEGKAVECSTLVEKLKGLVPRMFELRNVLVKGRGGLGNFKSLERYVDIVAGNLEEAYVAPYLQQLDEINQQVEQLIEGGLNNEIAEQLQSAQSKVAALGLIKNTVMAFDSKLQTLVSRIGDKYEALHDGLATVKKQQTSSEAKAAIQAAMGEFQQMQESVTELGQDLHEYCLLQVAYNSAIMG